MDLGWDKEKIEEFINNDKPVVIIDEEYFKDNYISKDKIRDKIKELEKFKKTDFGMLSLQWARATHTIEVLKELLEVLKELLKEDR